MTVPVTVEYRAQHKGAPGNTTVFTEDVDSAARIPRVGDYVCLADGWASVQVTMSTYLAYETRWIVSFIMGQSDAEDLRNAKSS